MHRHAYTSSLYAAGSLLLLSGVIHFIVWQLEDSSWNGPVSLRKPILFGLSAGVTLISLGWVAGKTRRRMGDGLFLSSLAIAMVIEVGLITLQQWRGVPSHFNRDTPLDAAILAGIDLLIVFVMLGIFELTRRSFGKLSADPDMAFAIRGGMVLLSFSCLLGIVLVGWGNYQLAQGRPPETFGAAGVMKFPHGVPMHAIQFLPVVAWGMRRLDVSQQVRSRSVILAFSATCAFTLYSLLQTFSGRARFEFWWCSAVVLAIAITLLVPTLIRICFATGRALAKKFRDLTLMRYPHGRFDL